jgi:hypothetical protein
VGRLLKGLEGEGRHHPDDENGSKEIFQNVESQVCRECQYGAAHCVLKITKEANDGGEHGENASCREKDNNDRTSTCGKRGLGSQKNLGPKNNEAKGDRENGGRDQSFESFCDVPKGMDYLLKRVHAVCFCFVLKRRKKKKRRKELTFWLHVPR